MPHNDQSREIFQRDFRVLYDRVSRFATFRLPTRDICDDVVAEVMMNAWRTIDAYEATEGDLAGWLIGIAKHKIADHWRSRKDELWDDESLDRLPGVDESIINKIDSKLAWDKIMATLPNQAKALLVLRHIDDLTAEEISVTVSKTPAAVRQALSRLYKKIRVQFPEYAK